MENQSLISYYKNRFFQTEHYRGHHFFQHSRYILENIEFILNYVNKYSSFVLPPGDLKNYEKGGKYQHERINYKQYDDMCVNYKIEFNKEGSQFNSLKKHLFPDMENMNLIYRSRVKRKWVVTLTKEGKELLEETDPTNKQMKWARAIGRAIETKSPTFLESLMKLLEIVNTVSKDEFVYFVSYLDYTEFYDYKEIAKLIEFSRIYPKELIKMKEDFTKRSALSLANDNIPKNKKLDYTNFNNSSKSTWNYIQEMIYFEVLNDSVKGGILSIRKSIKYKNKSITFRRDPYIKKQYNTKHNLDPESIGIYDYHHIIPLFHAGSVEEKIILDKWQNLICIDQNTHARITRSLKNNVVLKVNSSNVFLTDFLDDNEPIELKNGGNAKYLLETIIKDSSTFNHTTLKRMKYL